MQHVQAHTVGLSQRVGFCLRAMWRAIDEAKRAAKFSSSRIAVGPQPLGIQAGIDPTTLCWWSPVCELAHRSHGEDHRLANGQG